MKHLLIDFDNKLKLLLLDDTVILDIHSIEYTDTAAMIIDSVVKKFMPDKVTFITHNILSQCLYKKSVVAFEIGTGTDRYVSLINEHDFKVCSDICHKYGIADVSFVDKLGYYALSARADVCFVEKYTGVYRMFYKQGNKVTYQICTPDVYEETLQRFKTTTGALTVVNEDEMTDTEDLMYFLNSTMCLDDPEVVHDLVVFAYACMPPKEYTYTVQTDNELADSIVESKKNVKSTKNSDKSRELDVIQVEHKDNVKQEFNNGESLKKEQHSRVQPKKIKEKELKEKKVKEKKVKETVKDNVKAPKTNLGFIANLLFVIGALSVLCVGYLTLQVNQQVKKIAELEKTVQANQVMVSSIKTTIETYQTYLADSNQQIASIYSDVNNTINALDDATLVSYNYDTNNIVMTLEMTKEDSKTAIEDYCNANGFSVETTESNSVVLDSANDDTQNFNSKSSNKNSPEEQNNTSYLITVTANL